MDTTQTTKPATIDALFRQYQALLAQVPTVIGAGLPADQQTLFNGLLQLALENWQAAGLSQLKSDDPAWSQVAVATKAAQQTIDGALTDMANLSKTVNLMSQLINDVAKAIKLL